MEEVACTEPWRTRGEMALQDDNHGAVGGGGVPPQRRPWVLALRKFFGLPMETLAGSVLVMDPQNASRPPTEPQDTEDTSTQSSSEPLVGPVKRKTSKCQSPNECDSVESKRSQQDVYIQIPLSVMSGNESTSNKNPLFSHEDESPSSPVEGQNVIINYKLIEGFPSCADIRKRKSYVMSYNTETKNAEWVYEILNKSTLQNKCKENISFGKNELDNPNYHQGHLAAAANHRWCQQAYHDTYLMSNMTPQLSLLNEGMWRTLEKYCRDLAEPECNVHVYTGPLYLCNNKKGDYVRVLDPENPNSAEKAVPTKKAVPTDLFKVIIVEKNGRVENLKCYVMPNKEPEYTTQYTSAKKDNYSSNQNTTNDELLDYFEKSIEDIQILSGLKFKIDKPQHNMTDHKEKITWTGEDGNGESCEAKTEVKILIVK